MIQENDVYKIGNLTRTHGVRGEVAFQFTDDVWDRVEADYLFLRLDGLLVPFFLEEWRFRSDTTALVKFEDIDDVNAATIALSCASNSGPTLNLHIGEAISWGALPATAKWLLSGLMLMGRLEIFSVVVLFTTAFWKER